MRGCQILLSQCRLNVPECRPNVATTNEYEPTKLRIFTVTPVYHLPGNVISAFIGHVHINLQPKYEHSSSSG